MREARYFLSFFTFCLANIAKKTFASKETKDILHSICFRAYLLLVQARDALRVIP